MASGNWKAGNHNVWRVTRGNGSGQLSDSAQFSSENAGITGCYFGHGWLIQPTRIITA